MATSATPSTPTVASSSLSNNDKPEAMLAKDALTTDAVDEVNLPDDEEAAAAEGGTDETSKLKMLLGILKRMVGVKDMASIRLSLPANLLEPVPNLEYWQYLDRGDLFACLGTPEQPLERMLALLRFFFSKDLKFVHGKVCKPYNSILGEHFRCHWDVFPPQVLPTGDLLPVQHLLREPPDSLHPGPFLNGSSSSTTSLSAKGSSGLKGKKASPNASKANLTSPSGSSLGGAASPTRPSASRQGSNSVSAPATSSATPTPLLSPVGDADSVKSGKSSKSGKSFASSFLSRTNGGSPSKNAGASSAPTTASSPPEEIEDAKAEANEWPKKARITFLTEQVSHHPPISAYYCEARRRDDTEGEAAEAEAGAVVGGAEGRRKGDKEEAEEGPPDVCLCGVDQISAKFTGTNVRVAPGDRNKGLFLTLPRHGEEYQITHPNATINGIFRGNLWVAIEGSSFITCRAVPSSAEEKEEGQKSERLRTIVEYKEESWIRAPRYAVEGVIYTYEHDPSVSDDEQPDEGARYTKIKQVPEKRVVATIEGCWRGKIWWKRKGDKDARLLINLGDLSPLPKRVRPIADQEPMESRRNWEPVTEAILAKEYGKATRNKQVIEQKQRDKAAARKEKGEDFVPQYFHPDISTGRATLTPQGLQAVRTESARRHDTSSDQA